MLALRFVLSIAAAIATFAIPGIAAATVPGDTTPPVLTLSADLTVVASWPPGAYVYYGASAWDDGDGASVPVTCTPQSGSLFLVGVTTVECSATDSSGNTATGTFTVTVLKPDTTPPVLYGIPSSPVVLEPQSVDGAFYSYFVSASDNWDGWDPVTCTPPSGMFPIGTTTVECSSTDSWGNTATASFTVTVLQPLVLTVTVSGGTVNPVTGVATVTGTVECTRSGAPARASVSLYGSLTQRIGRVLITGGFGTMNTGGFIDCASPAAPWSFSAASSSGLFVAGSADFHTSAYGGSMIETASADGTIKLRAQR